MELISTFLTSLVMLIIWMAVSSVSCGQKYPNSFHPKYSLFSGCTIEVDNVRIPAENYRKL